MGTSLFLRPYIKHRPLPIKPVDVRKFQFLTKVSCKSKPQFEILKLFALL